MSDGTKAGLITREQFREQMEQDKKLAEQRKRDAQGANTATVYRDKATGKVTTQEEHAESRAKKKKKEEKPEDQFIAWRGGMAQQRQAELQQQRQAEEAAAPFARYSDDTELDSLLRHRDRWGDPMAGAVRKREDAGPTAVTQKYDQALLEKSGFIIPQEIPQHSWLKRGVAAPENRYGIRPGRHWDGVDRSTGFEKELFKERNERAAMDLEARMWSQADM